MNPRPRSRPPLATAALGLALAAAACTTVTDHSDLPDLGGPGANPPAEGFDLAGSDARAIEIADRVMDALGGRRAWDETRTLSWVFFDRRRHVWDRSTGDVRIESLADDGSVDGVVLMNVDTREGRAWRDGAPVTDPEELEAALEAGYHQWVNDSYWLLMPYKLKDSGVTLRHVGEGALPGGRPADVLELTFDEVGVTPQNKYRVLVARDTSLVEQWSYYREAGDEQPALTTPWTGWRRRGGILLSGDRGEFGGLREILVMGKLPRSVFQDPDPISPAALAAASR